MVGVAYLFFPTKVKEFYAKKVHYKIERKWYLLQYRICGAGIILMALMLFFFTISNFIKR
jgi:hypothetical protein